MEDLNREDEVRAELEDAFEAKDSAKVYELNEELRRLQKIPGDDVEPEVEPVRERVKFPLDIFPDDIKLFSTTVARSTESPVDAVAFSVLGMASACYGTHLRLEVFEGYTTWCHDFLTIVAPSSFGKTPIFKHVEPPLREIERTLRAAELQEVNAAQARITVLQSKKTKLIKGFKLDGSEEELAADVQGIDEEVAELETVTLPQVIVSDVTPEALIKIQSENGDAASMVSGETPLWGKLCGRASGKPPDIEPFLSSYDGEFYRVDRITRSKNWIEEARLAIIVATQDAVAHDIHSRPDLSDRGLIARFFFYRAEALTESELVDEEVPVGEDVRGPYERKLTSLGLRFRNELHPPFRMNEAGAKVYRDWQTTFKRRHRLESGDLHDIAPFARKLENKVLRWSCLLHVLWNDDPGVLDVEDIERGLALVDFALDNFRAVEDLVGEGPVKVLIQSLTSYFAGKRGKTITLRDLRRSFSPFHKADIETRKAALDELEEEGTVEVEKLGSGKRGGRRSTVVRVL